MAKRGYRSGLLIVVVLAAGLSICSCGGDGEQLARKKLDLILPDDLKAIVAGIPKDALIDKPYDTITSFKTFKKGLYSAKAEVDFYFLQKVHVKIIRKFRYHRSKKMWERYFNEYRYLSDSTAISAKN
jgi:hypothetical protein